MLIIRELSLQVQDGLNVQMLFQILQQGAGQLLLGERLVAGELVLVIEEEEMPS